MTIRNRSGSCKLGSLGMHLRMRVSRCSCLYHPSVESLLEANPSNNPSKATREFASQCIMHFRLSGRWD